MRAIAVLIVLFAPARADMSVGQREPVGYDVLVRARLVEWKRAAPACGTSQFAEVMRYEVMDVLEGSLTRNLENRPPAMPLRDVLVAQPCPELPRRRYRYGAGDVESFDLNAVHELMLSQEAPPGVTIVKPFEIVQAVYFAQRTFSADRCPILPLPGGQPKDGCPTPAIAGEEARHPSESTKRLMNELAVDLARRTPRRRLRIHGTVAPLLRGRLIDLGVPGPRLELAPRYAGERGPAWFEALDETP